MPLSQSGDVPSVSSRLCAPPRSRALLRGLIRPGCVPTLRCQGSAARVSNPPARLIRPSSSPEIGGWYGASGSNRAAMPCKSMPSTSRETPRSVLVPAEGVAPSRCVAALPILRQGRGHRVWVSSPSVRLEKPMTSPEVERGRVLPVGIEPTQCALEERLLSSAEAWRWRHAAVTIRTIARLQRAVLPELHVVVRAARIERA
jgi:hypothetical protein